MSSASPESESRNARIKARLESLRELFSAGSNADQYSGQFDEYIQQGEFASALECLCEFLMEPDVRPVSDPEMGEIVALHNVMSIRDQCAIKLKNKRIEQAKQFGLVEEAVGYPKLKAVSTASPIPAPATLSSSPAPSPATIPSSLRYKLIAVVGRDHVHPTGPSDQIAGVQPKLVIVPGSESELAEVLRLANEAGITVIPRGGATKLDWGSAPSRADLVVSTARLNRVLEHAWADLTVTVEAGCTIQTLQETLAQHGQRLAIDPLWPDKATIGGILSTNDSGALRLRFGALRDLIIGVTIALPDGTLAASGGKVVKNVAGYDLPKLVTGAFGTLGVITHAVFRLHPLPHNARSFSIATANPAATRDLILAIQNSKLAHTAIQSCFSNDAVTVTDILFEGTEAGLDAQTAQLREICKPLEIPEAAPDVWQARQALWSHSLLTAPAETPDVSPDDFPSTTAPLETPASKHQEDSCAIVKISILPADLAHVVEFFQRVANLHRVQWKLVMYGTGLGWLRLEGTADHLQPALLSLRGDLEKKEGSLVVLRRPAKLSALDLWGTPGDSLPLMKAVKHRLDPANTLNPGRFLGGI
jgi:glycolate oxidase FAD binding subunit